ncbi:MAG: hypothetical protein JRJ58_11520 [Deltaproteobacteria bacterium]|nr:hypothetical protein [Deltaproteobacteria bacterium]
MSQLNLFEGSHIPSTAAREALRRGELDEARAQLGLLGDDGPEAVDAVRIERVLSGLSAGHENSIASVHSAFASAFSESEARGLLSDGEWFVVYARLVAQGLGVDPGRRFRGWLGADFAFAVGEPEAALRAASQIVEKLPPGPAWIAASRIEFALGRAESARKWIQSVCLDTSTELDPEPPALESSGVPSLDAAPPLPPLPSTIQDLFEAMDEIEGLPGARAPWVAVVGEIDRIFGPIDADPEASTARELDPAREFLVALRAARHSRERDGSRRADRCSDRELRARKRMQRLAPALLERYMRGLRGSLL